MKPNARIHAVPSSDLAGRVAVIDWEQAERDLDAQGCAMLKGLLAPDECRALAAVYADDAHFRSRIVMSR
ncbi:MAG: proline hydroxylase, partial [Bradyrhizobium sp.]|nr:proline hydroxylase [Bradyrhizobium sp.]